MVTRLAEYIFLLLFVMSSLSCTCSRFSPFVSSCSCDSLLRLHVKKFYDRCLQLDRGSDRLRFNSKKNILV